MQCRGSASEGEEHAGIARSRRRVANAFRTADAATCEFKDMDTGKVVEYAGAELMKRGLPIGLPTPQQAAPISYKRAAK